MRESDWSSDVCSSDLIASNSRFSTTVLPVPLPPTKGGGSTISSRLRHWPKDVSVSMSIWNRAARRIPQIIRCSGPTSLSNLVRVAGQGAEQPCPHCLRYCSASTGSNNNCSAIRVRRFCSINGSTIDPQLMHRHTNVSGEKSGRHSSTINPWHRPHVMVSTSLECASKA